MYLITLPTAIVLCLSGDLDPEVRDRGEAKRARGEIECSGSVIAGMGWGPLGKV